jgi:hypothetical protein
MKHRCRTPQKQRVWDRQCWSGPHAVCVCSCSSSLPSQASGTQLLSFNGAAAHRAQPSHVPGPSASVWSCSFFTWPPCWCYSQALVRGRAIPNHWCWVPGTIHFTCCVTACLLSTSIFSYTFESNCFRKQQEACELDLVDCAISWKKLIKTTLILWSALMLAPYRPSLQRYKGKLFGEPGGCA